MNQRSFSLEGNSFIELNKLLKICSVAQSGGEAKMLIKEGIVLVNNKKEERIRRKLNIGDLVSVASVSIRIVE